MMKSSNHLLWIIITLIIFASLAFGLQNATSSNSASFSSCTCATCQECESMINNDSCSVVFVTNDLHIVNRTCVTITHNGKTLDCQGHKMNATIYPNESYHDGIRAGNVQNIEVRNCKIFNFNSGFWWYNVNNSVIKNNTLRNRVNGVVLWGSGNTILHNNATNNYDGFIISGKNNRLLGNIAMYNRIGYRFNPGSCRNELSNNIGCHNVVNGIPRDVSCPWLSCSSGHFNNYAAYGYGNQFGYVDYCPNIQYIPC